MDKFFWFLAVVYLLIGNLPLAVCCAIIALTIYGVLSDDE